MTKQTDQLDAFAAMSGRFWRAVRLTEVPLGRVCRRMNATNKAGVDGRLQSAFEGDGYSLKRTVDFLVLMLHCDPRWVFTGQESPASAAKRRIIARHPGVSRREAPLLHELLSMSLQPEIAPGFCRYCGCRQESGCEEGCFWVDGQWTICSACLFPEEE